MKKLFLPFNLILVLSLLVIALIFLFQSTRQKTNGSEQISDASQTTNSSTDATSTSSNPPSVVVTQANQNQVVVQASVNADQTGTLREQQLQREVSSQNIPVNFWGMIVDQNNQPVVGASVKMMVCYLEYSSSNGMTSAFPRFETLTDAQGHFSWTEESGDVLSLESITKNGYVLSPKTPHSFGPSSGTFENPVIFKMWKKGAGEQLIGGSHVFRIDSGKTYTLNLMTGKKVEDIAEGDLLVSITRPADAKPRNKFAWSFSIEAIQGGFAEPDRNDEFMYIAPESGYQPKIEIQFDPNDPAWAGTVKKQFFITSRNGQVYGRASIEIDSIYNVHSAIQIDYTINPNSSRNLQP